MAIELPYFKMYPADFEMDAKVKRMTLAQVGLYIHCLNLAWINGSLPADEELIRRMFRLTKGQMKKLWPEVLDCFTEENGRLTNKRQEEERTQALERSNRNSIACTQRKDHNVPGFIYLLKRSKDGAVKIGSSQHVSKRVAQLNYKYRDSMELLGSFAVERMTDVEVALHRKFAHKRVHGEWFVLSQGDIDITLKGDIHCHPSIRAYASVSESVSPEGGGGGNRTLPAEDASQQVGIWLRQYCDRMGAGFDIDLQTAFRLTRTMIEQGRDLDYFERVLHDLIREKQKPKSVGWLITVIEAKLGEQVAYGA